MPTPRLVILYVTNPLRSRHFYELLLGIAPAKVFPTYVAFELDNRFHLGLWSIHAADFVSRGTGRQSELAIMVDRAEEVDALYRQWKQHGIVIEQEPMEAVFGRTFVALNPDGHRLRVCLPDGYRPSKRGSHSVRSHKYPTYPDNETVNGK